MSDRLGLVEAEGLVADRLGDTPRAAHSRFVARVLDGLATGLGQDTELWRVVGLVHDLDFFAVQGDWPQHGRLTVKWLAGRLPAEALEAIASHDHRSGITSDTLLADMLKLADALAVLDETAGREATTNALRLGALAGAAGSRPYLAEMIATFSGRAKISHERLASLLEGLPRQA